MIEKEKAPQLQGFFFYLQVKVILDLSLCVLQALEQPF